MQDNRNYGKLGAHLIFEVLGGMWVCGDCVCVRGGGLIGEVQQLENS